MHFKITEIFKSIEGEGLRAGLPATFVRLHGCNLQCSYCDSQYSCTGDDYKTMELGDVLEIVRSLGCPWVTVTGGEPLVAPGVHNLLIALLDDGFDVNVETNGSVDTRMFRNPALMYTVDVKCPSSGMHAHMALEQLPRLAETDVVKFVVGSEADMEYMYGVLLKYATPAQVFISPVFGQIEPQEIVEWMLDAELYDARVQLQMHKIIWPPEMRGV